MTPPHQTEKKTMTTENQKHSKNDAHSKFRTQGHPNAMQFSLRHYVHSTFNQEYSERLGARS